MKLLHYHILIFILLFSCKYEKSAKQQGSQNNFQVIEIPNNTFPEQIISESLLPDTIIDSNYTFEEATKGSQAPEEIINMLELVDVFYLSTDNKIHKGQVLTNRQIAGNIREIFNYMLEKGFIIYKAVPIVRYDWSDSLSMDDNNSYSFCYRNISYSKHAEGMAIDINPRFNSLRCRDSDKTDQPVGAVSDTTVNGTLYPGHPVVDEFRRLGFRWGHYFTKYYDDHHFEKR